MLKILVATMTGTAEMVAEAVRDRFGALGGKKIGRLLVDLGATMLGEPLCHDASAGTMPEDVAVDWFQAWVEAHDVLAEAAKDAFGAALRRTHAPA